MNRRSLAIWFVAGSQHLYGPGPLATVASNAQVVSAPLDAESTLPVSMVCKPIVTTAAEILQGCREANSAENCIGLVFWMHTFSPAKMWIAGLRELRKPFLHPHTQFNEALPYSSIDMDFINLNQAAHGDREFGHITARLRLPRKVVVGYWKDRLWWRRWPRGAAPCWNEAQHLKVARFGDNMRNVAVTDGDKVAAQEVFGFEVHGYGIGDLTDRMAHFPTWKWTHWSASTAQPTASVLSTTVRTLCGMLRALSWA